MHDTTPHRYSLRSASRRSMEVPRTPPPNRQNRSSSPKPMRVLRNSSVVRGRPEIVSPTPAARAYAIRFHQRRRKVAALVLGDKHNISQFHRLLCKPPAKTPIPPPTLVMTPKAPTTSVRPLASNRSVGPDDSSHQLLAIDEDQLYIANQTKPQSRV
jgi:hypothetical protein